MTSEIETSITGSISENVVIGEFLKRGFDVYLPVVDRGIDCIISSGGNYYEIQIKTRFTAKKGKHIFDVWNFTVRDNFFIVCYQAELYSDVFWIIPSRMFSEYGYQNKNNVYRLVLNPEKQKILEKYKNNFHQFREQ